MSHNFGQPESSQDPDERLTSFQDCGMGAFEDMTLSEFTELDPDQENVLFDQEVSLIELVRWLQTGIAHL